MKELKKEMSEVEYNEFVEYSYEFSIENIFKDFYSLSFGIVGREAIHDWDNPNYNYDDTL